MADEKKNHHALTNMTRALETYRTRNRVYGNNYKRFGEIMRSLYPNGIELKTEQQWNRMGILIPIVAKLARYTTDPEKGHMDSIHDIGVYSFMLEELDAEGDGMDVNAPEKLVTVYAKDASGCQHVYEELKGYKINDRAIFKCIVPECGALKG